MPYRNPEDQRAYGREYGRRNRERIRARKRLRFSDPVVRHARYLQDKDRVLALSADRYARKKTEINAQIRAKKGALRERVNALKAVPCADCGKILRPQHMDFDHVRGPKVACISALISRLRPWDVIVAEIAKCELVCKFCHTDRTFRRQKEGVSIKPSAEQLAVAFGEAKRAAAAAAKLLELLGPEQGWSEFCRSALACGGTRIDDSEQLSLFDE